MKKILFILAIVVLFALSSCASENNANPEVTTTPIETASHEETEYTGEVQYGSIHVDSFFWNSAQELVSDEDTDYVLIGKVTDISFQVMDKRTGLTPAPGAKEKYDIYYGEVAEPRWVFELVTIYDLDVLTTYKGEGDKVAQIRMMGGLRDYRVEEQLSVMKEYDLDYIPILSDAPEIKIGETYLFVLYQYDTCLPAPMSMHQGIYNLRDPFEKNTVNRSYLRDDPADYYSKSTDEYGNPIYSAKDVISVFGRDKWKEFWTQWQKDNPDWETRLDKKAVKRALAAR